MFQCLMLGMHVTYMRLFISSELPGLAGKEVMNED